MKKIISTTDAPAAIGPYSQAVRAGSLVFAPAGSRSIRKPARSFRKISLNKPNASSIA